MVCWRALQIIALFCNPRWLLEALQLSVLPPTRPGLGMIMCLAFLTVQIKIPLSPPAAPAVPRTAVCKRDKCGMWLSYALDFRKCICFLELVLSASLRSSCWFFSLADALTLLAYQPVRVFIFRGTSDLWVGRFVLLSFVMQLVCPLLFRNSKCKWFMRGRRGVEFCLVDLKDHMEVSSQFPEFAWSSVRGFVRDQNWDSERVKLIWEITLFPVWYYAE